MEAIALVGDSGDYVDRLKFRLGDVMKVLRFTSHSECRAEIDGREGAVRRSFIKIHPCGWFGGDISSQQARQLILQQRFNNENGLFLVRHSSQAGCFALSVKVDLNEVKDFLILRDGGSYFIWQHEKFLSINRLIVYYQTHPLVNFDGSISITLRQCDGTDMVIIGQGLSHPLIAAVDNRPRAHALPVVKSSVLVNSGLPIPMNFQVIQWNFGGRQHGVRGPIELHLKTADSRPISGVFSVTDLAEAPDLIVTEEMLDLANYQN